MNTKPIIHVGIALILLGVATLIYQSAAYTRLEPAIDANHAEVGAAATNVIPLSPLAGGVLLGSGIVLLAIGLKMSPWRQKT